MQTLNFTKKHWPINHGYVMRALPKWFAWDVRLAYVETLTLIKEEIGIVRID